MPGMWKKSSNLIQLCIVRALLPNQFTPAVRDFLARSSEGLGSVFMEILSAPAVADALLTPGVLGEQKSDRKIEQERRKAPLLLVIAEGANPADVIEKLVDTSICTYQCLSMGLGMTATAESLLEESYTTTLTEQYIFLQNIHLVPRWLNRLCNILAEKHASINVIMSTEASSKSLFRIPRQLLALCDRLVLEPPTGFGDNLRLSLSCFSEESLESDEPAVFRTLIFSLLYFHSCTVTRKTYGTQGWSSEYPFSVDDLKLSARIVKEQLRDHNFETMKYIISKILYGGHISDPWDQRVCDTYLEHLITEGVGEGGYSEDIVLAPANSNERFSGFSVPNSSRLSHDDMTEYVTNTFGVDEGSNVGLSDSFDAHMIQMCGNARLIRLETECRVFYASLTAVCLESIDDIDSRGAEFAEGDVLRVLNSSFEDKFAKVKKQIGMLLDQIPNYDEELYHSYESDGSMEDPYVNFLAKEGSILTYCCRTSRRELQELEAALSGTIDVSSVKHGDILNGLVQTNLVPQSWLSLVQSPNVDLSFTEWTDKVIAAMHVQEECEDSNWNVIHLPSVLNPKALIATIVYASARWKKVPLNQIVIKSRVTDKDPRDFVGGSVDSRKGGIYVSGLSLEGGALWGSGELVESTDSQLRTPLPVVHVQGVERSDEIKDISEDRSLYICPVYSDISRGTSFLFKIPMRCVGKESTWTLKGVAAVSVL